MEREKESLEDLKKLTKKLVLFFVLMTLIQAALYELQKNEIAETNVQLEGFLQNPHDIIFLGDSAVFVYGENEMSKTVRIAHLLQKLLPESRIADASRSSSRLDIHLAYIQFIVRHDKHPRMIIIPINLREFSPGWRMNPTSQLASDKFLLTHTSYFSHIFFRPMAIFRAINLTPVTEEQYLSTPVFQGTTPIGTVQNFHNTSYFTYSDEKMRKKISFYYMHELDRTYPNIQTLISLFEIFKSTNIRPIFYLTPIDHETGERFLGDAFRQQVLKNVAFLKSVFNEYGFEVLDLSFDLTPEFFYWPEEELYLNEHLKEKGAWYVAEKLKNAIQK